MVNITPIVAQLTPDDATRLVLAQRAVTDASRRAELSVARARVEVGDACEAQITVLRDLATQYGFSPDRRYLLRDDGCLVDTPDEARP